jgi:protein TonB
VSLAAAARPGRGPAGAVLALCGSLALNALLFLTVPLLTSGAGVAVPEPMEQGIFLAAPPPPPPERPAPPEPKKDPEPPPPPRMARVAPQRSQAPARSVRPMDAFDFEPARGLLAGAAVPPPEPGPARMDFELAEVDTPPRMLHGAPPAYPYEAKRRRLEGRVVVRALVLPDGSAVRATVVEALPPGIFDEAVLRALARWRFEPGVLDGRPVPTWVLIPFEFNLS